MTEQKTTRALQGTIVKILDPKTVIVEVKQRLRHKKYFKLFMRSNRYHVHVSGKPELAEGQQVSIVPDRPRSARKRWRLA